MNAYMNDIESKIDIERIPANTLELFVMPANARPRAKNAPVTASAVRFTIHFLPSPDLRITEGDELF